MTEYRLAKQTDLPEIAALYAEAGYGGGIDDSDTALVAAAAGNIVAAVRLCREHGVIVLRGMQVKQDFQRQGIGSHLLQACTPYLDGNLSFCLPYSHLTGFYRSVSFEPVDASGLPDFLAVRLSTYLARGQDVIAMKRQPYRSTAGTSLHPAGQ